MHVLFVCCDKNISVWLNCLIYIVFCMLTGEFGPIGGHSLSWSSEKGHYNGSVMVAKVWTPEDPRGGRAASLFCDTWWTHISKAKLFNPQVLLSFVLLVLFLDFLFRSCDFLDEICISNLELERYKLVLTSLTLILCNSVSPDHFECYHLTLF